MCCSDDISCNHCLVTSNPASCDDVPAGQGVFRMMLEALSTKIESVARTNAEATRALVRFLVEYTRTSNEKD